MTTATIILSIMGAAICIGGIIKDRPDIQSLGTFVCMLSLALAIISTM